MELWQTAVGHKLPAYQLHAAGRRPSLADAAGVVGSQPVARASRGELGVGLPCPKGMNIEAQGKRAAAQRRRVPPWVRVGHTVEP
jgi:hypothetical protein